MWGNLRGCWLMIPSILTLHRWKHLPFCWNYSFVFYEHNSARVSICLVHLCMLPCMAHLIYKTIVLLFHYLLLSYYIFFMEAATLIYFCDL